MPRDWNVLLSQRVQELSQGTPSESGEWKYSYQGGLSLGYFEEEQLKRIFYLSPKTGNLVEVNVDNSDLVVPTTWYVLGDSAPFQSWATSEPSIFKNHLNPNKWMFAFDYGSLFGSHYDSDMLRAIVVFDSVTGQKVSCTPQEVAEGWDRDPWTYVESTLLGSLLKDYIKSKDEYKHLLISLDAKSEDDVIELLIEAEGVDLPILESLKGSYNLSYQFSTEGENTVDDSWSVRKGVLRIWYRRGTNTWELATRNYRQDGRTYVTRNKYKIFNLETGETQTVLVT